MYQRWIGRVGVLVVMALMAVPLLAQSNGKAVQNALSLKKQGKLDRAIAQLNKALQANSGDAKAHYVLAWTLIMKSKKEEAATHFQKAIAANLSGQDLTEAQEALQRMGKTVAASPSAAGNTAAKPSGGKRSPGGYLGAPAGAGKMTKAPGAPSGGITPPAGNIAKAPGAPPGAPPGALGAGPAGGPMGGPAGGPPGAPAGGPPGMPSGTKVASAPAGAPLPPGAPGASEGKSKATSGAEPEKKGLPLYLLIGVPAAIILAVSVVLQKKMKKGKAE